MKRNPVIPFAIIAVLGILAVIVLSVVGLDQQEKIASGDDHGEEESARTDPEEIVQSCIGCHGTDLEGSGGAPSLQHVGSEYSKEEILDIINNGIEGTSMMGGIVPPEEAEVLASWLAEKK